MSRTFLIYHIYYTYSINCLAFLRARAHLEYSGCLMLTLNIRVYVNITKC